jgi:hypothetical protein
MEQLKFILKYWPQFTFIAAGTLAALFYGVQVYLNYKFKKKEVYYSLYASEKVKALTSFFDSTYLFINKVQLLKHAVRHHQEFEKAMDEFNEVHANFMLAGNRLTAFLPDKEYYNVSQVTQVFKFVSEDLAQKLHGIDINPNRELVFKELDKANTEAYVTCAGALAKIREHLLP